MWRLGAVSLIADGLFWLIYTDVKRFGRTSVAGASGASMRDFHNYLVTSPSIDGDWSDPIYLNSAVLIHRSFTVTTDENIC
jgi:beta-xylosidase